MRSLEDLQEAMRVRLAQEGLATAAVPPRRDKAQAPLSFGQRYVWAHQQISPESTAYNLCLALTFEGQVEVAALRVAFESLVRRHEVLRTTYHTRDDGEPYQRIHDHLPPRLTEADLTGAQADRLAELAAAAAREPFDLAAESSLRVCLARVDAAKIVAVVVIQHIAWDGMTLSALSRDVADYYRQALVGRVEVEPLRRQVADFAEWEQDRFHAGDHTDEMRFWESRFDGEVPELRLPYDRRPVTVTERGARADRPLSAAADASLRRLTAQLSTTPFSVFLAAYYLALRQLTGQDDIVIGTTVANREEPGMELLVGNLGNMLPLHLTGHAASTFAELVARVSSTTTEAFRRRHFPQEHIVRAVNAVTGNIGSRLFETMVLFLHRQIDGPQLPGARTSWELIDNGAALLPLVVETFLHADRTDVQITYRTDLFDEPTIDRLHEYIDGVLATATQNIALPELLRLSSADRARLLDWSHGPSMDITPETADGMIRAASRDYPQRTAVVFGDKELTYAEFDARVNRLARLLVSRGVRNGDHVAVYAERSEWLPVTFAAVLRVGAVYVPLDPSYPAERLAYMLGDAQPTLLVRAVFRAERAALPVDTDVTTVDLTEPEVLRELNSRDAAVLGGEEITRPVHPLDGAYLLYTSGTTGRPKGVVIHHRGIANHVQWIRDHLRFGTERILQKAPIGFDVSVYELVNALCTGSTTVLPPVDWWQADVEALAGIIEQHRITQISLVPSVVRAFIDAGPDPARLRSMRYVYLGGEAVPPALVEEASRYFGGTVLGLYGPTEASMDLMHEDFATTEPRDPAIGDCVEPALIGVPESNSSVYVLDDGLRQVAPGVVGELYLGGVQLAQGYHRRPDLTAAAFVACPFAGVPGARMYRTGDVARWNGHGRLEYLGRVDDQVKVRGHRIELGEIGTALSSAPGVASAAAIARTPEHARAQHTGDAVLVGYYVIEAESPLAAEPDSAHTDRLLAYLSTRLPEYMVPVALVRMAALPLTANGKLDRRALPAPELGREAGRGRALRDDAEQAVAAAIRHVLGLADTVDLAADDDFLALGGDSITAIRIAAALKERGLQITTSALFTARTVGRIAAATTSVAEETISTLLGDDGATGWVALNPIARMLVQAPGDHRGFTQATAVVTPADCTAGELREALAMLLIRHPMLRARLAVDPSGQPAFAVPGTDEGFTAPALDEVVCERDGWQHELHEQLRKVSGALDPAEGPVVGAVWLHAADGGHGRLLLVVHHLVVDGVSWRIINDDLRRWWRSGADGAANTPNSGTSVRSWNHGLAMLATEQATLGTLAHWTRIASAPDPLLGSRTLDPAVDTADTVREVTAELSDDETRFLMTQATRAFGCGFLDLQAAALAVAVHRLRRRHDRDAPTVSITMERHGRVETLFAGARLDNTVGWFTTTHPLVLAAVRPADEPAEVGRQGRGDDLDIEFAVKAVKEQLSAVADSGIGWGLLRWLNPQTQQILAAYAPPQISFNYMGRFAVAESDADDWDAAPEFGYLGGHQGDGMPAPALLDINTVTLTDGDTARLRSSFRFPSGAITEDEVATLAQLWTSALREVAEAVRENRSRRLTPSDVLADGLTQLDLDRWHRQYGAYEDVYPLAPMQSGLYLTALSAGSKDVYNVQTLIGVAGTVDVARLARAFDVVLNRYPNLRVTVSVSLAGAPYAIVAEQMDVPVVELDISDAEDQRGRLDEFYRADQAAPFDLAQGPLTRVTVLRLPDTTRMIVLTMHHLLLDGWSGQLLAREVFAEYAVSGAKPIGNPETFAKFLAITREQEQATETAWRATLTDLRPCLVAPSRGTEIGAPALREFAIDDDLVHRLTAVAAELGTTFSVVCQLAWANTLRCLTGEDTAIFGEAVSGRPAELDEVDSAIGCFANIVPAVVELRAESSWRAHLAEMHARRIELMEFHQYPLSSAVRASGTRKLFDSMFVFESYPPGRKDLEHLLATAGLELTSFEGGGATDNALLLMIFPANSLLPSDSVQAVIFYGEDVLEHDDARIVETAFDNTLRAIAEQPQSPLGAAAVLDDEDQGLLVMRRMWQ
ncbi:amino acid adenylation domain-containing protein [Nocardia callitridis]|uniref:Carrier domain-containing protein n=1 Tax=Nocardia callitridis TaxID=648753 RepID=A0ABP9KYM1_9NOCA